jgi:hypothetical protein
MRSFKPFSKGLLVAGLLAASLVGISGCGPDYSLFKVTVNSKDSPRNTIGLCQLTITDENGNLVLDRYHLKPVYGAPDSNGATLLQGCEPSLTTGNIVTLSYSSSRTTGSLTFKVDAIDDSNGGSKLVQTGSSSADPKVYHGPSDEVPVPITIGVP